jgi:hypothetical protein
MSSKLGLKLLAGAVALSIAGGAFAANTSADANGTIFLNIVDTTQNTSYMFDTGVLVTSFNGNTSTYSQSIATDANYASFVATQKSGDVIDYSVVGTTNAPDGSGFTPTALVTAVSTPSTVAGLKSNDVATQIGTFLGQVNNQAGKSTFNPASAPSTAIWPGYEPTVQTDLGGGSDNALIGTALSFYDLATQNASGTRSGAVVTLLGHTWNLSTAGLLTYNVSAVPLPAPLVLLLSGLGLMGVLTRRGPRQSVMGGALA